MKKLLLKGILAILLIAYGFGDAYAASVTYTALAGNATHYLYTSSSQTNLVVYGFQLTVPSGSAYSLVQQNFNITTSQNLNGFVTAKLVKVASADPALAISAPQATYNGNVGASTIQFSASLSFASPSTSYYYLVLSMSSTANAISFSSFTFSIGTNTSDGKYNNVTPSPINRTDLTTTERTYYIGSTYTWNGGSTTWTSNSNWNDANGNHNSRPGANDLANIGTISFTNQPTISGTTSVGSINFGSAKSSTLSIGTQAFTVNRELTISSGATATITGTSGTITLNDVTNSGTATISNTGTVNIGGDLTNNSSATLTSNTNTVNFNSSSDQSLANSNTSTTPSVKFKNLTFSGGGTKTISGSGYSSLSETGILTLSGSTILSIPSLNTHLQLLANSSSFAQVEEIPSTAAIKGYIDYQVYFLGNGNILYRNYRSMGAPVYNNTTTYSSGNGSYNLASLKGTFIITGSGGTNNGFDASTNNGATLRTYNTTTNDYTYITSLNSNPTVTSGTGFYMFFRGDKVTKPNFTTNDPYGSKTNKLLGVGGNAYANPESVVFNYTGIPNQGDVDLITVPASLAGYYYFVANPYPATLDAKLLWQSTNYGSFFGAPLYGMSSTVYTWSPVAGKYAYYDVNSGANNNGGKQYIMPGQGFFIRNTFLNFFSSGLTITATESMKSTTNSGNVARLLSTSGISNNAQPPITRLQLLKSGMISDEVSIVISNTAKDSSELSDAPHMNGDYMNLTTITPDNKYLAIDKRPFTGAKKVIPLFLNVAVDSIYTFKNTMNNTAMSNYKVTLYDSLLNNSVDIVHNDYKFNISRANTATYGGKRFKLIIEAKPAPVTYFDFGGKLTDNKKGLLTWQTNIYREGTTYQLQRSQDNVTFNDISTARTGVEATPKNTFEVLDNDIQAGKNYYRLVQTDVFNNKTVSNTVMLNVSADVGPVDIKNGFKLYPNPVATTLSVVSDRTFGKVTMRVYDSMSSVLTTKTFSELTAYQPIAENVSQLKMGVYFVELRDSNNNVLTTLKFLKQ